MKKLFIKRKKKHNHMYSTIIFFPIYVIYLLLLTHEIRAREKDEKNF